MATAEERLGKLARLKVDKARGDPAPHKPLLLLLVLEFAAKDPTFGSLLPLTPELAFRFCTYWSIVAHRRTQAPDVRYPFFHLKSDGFWSPHAEDGKPAVDRRLARSAVLPRDLVGIATRNGLPQKGLVQ
jgi:putative restriction endonuclease